MLKSPVVEAADRLLPLEEPEARELLAAVFRGAGVDVIVGAAATNVSYEASSRLPVTDGRELVAEQLLAATGRRVDLAGIGADALGVDVGFPRSDANWIGGPGQSPIHGRRQDSAEFSNTKPLSPKGFAGPSRHNRLLGMIHSAPLPAAFGWSSA